MKKAFFITFFWLFFQLLNAQPTLIMSRALDGSGQEQYRMIRQLEDFSPEEFTPQDKERIAAKLRDVNTPHRDKYMLLAGYLELTAALEAVPKSTLTSEKLKRSHGLALVRAGVKSTERILLKNIKALDYDDEFTYDVLPLLMYTHSRVIYDYVIELVLTENLSCLPPDPHASGNIDCGYRLMEALAEVIVDFPFELGPSGDIEVADYRKALQETRNWLRRHRQDYQIVAGKY